MSKPAKGGVKAVQQKSKVKLLFIPCGFPYVHLQAIQPGGRQSNSLSCPWQSHVKSLSHGEKKSVGCYKFPQRHVLNKLNLVEKTSARQLEIRS